MILSLYITMLNGTIIQLEQICKYKLRHSDTNNQCALFKMLFDFSIAILTCQVARDVT